MLIDNKTIFANNPKTIIEFFERYMKSGNLETVTGYFSVSMLSYLYQNYPNLSEIKMILGGLIKDEANGNKIVDLFNEQINLANALSINHTAKTAVDFLSQEKVQIKTVKPNFCHAKTYIFEDEAKDPQKSFFILGSSNLTDAGLGARASSNVELNTANFGSAADYTEVKAWFNNLWKNPEAKEFIEVEGKKVEFKRYLIEQISRLFREYTPEQLYYKVLFELFKEDLIDIEPNSYLQKQIEFLKDTIVYNTLYPFQKKGVLSLIQKIQKHNGAILADAVGLGKTWQALAVMKYFELQGYEVVLFCPKKLENNWLRYLEKRGSKFEKDRFNYVVRYHTDLQDTRLNKDGITIERYFQKKPKFLFVIDESHNLRNDKSSRYEFLVEELLKQNKDVKVLLLSATPINTKLTDVRNQFKLFVKGEDSGFGATDFAIPSLQALFANAQKDFNEWQSLPERKIAQFITSLPSKFFELTDALIVARTREIIKKQDLDGIFNFPQKEKPLNEYIGLKKIGGFESFDDLINALKINFTAYRPAEYTKDGEVTSVLVDEKQRQKFLAKMMYILLIKRLESSWFSFKNTIQNVLAHSENALEKVDKFLSTKKPDEIMLPFDKDTEDELEQEAEEYLNELGEDAEENKKLTLGKKNPIAISSITQIDKFRYHLQLDIDKLKKLKRELAVIEKNVANEVKIKNNYYSADIKLEKLIEIIVGKRNTRDNKKVVIFSVYTDTVTYLYEQLKARGFVNIAFVSGSRWETDKVIKGESNKDFEHILERFAPFTKLFNERDWSDLYKEHGVSPISDYEEWKCFIRRYDKSTAAKLDNPIDILIATDCLSEGQNLQDADCVINYDIHWNPVRIIQRMGRIDRLGSPNKSILGINFWPASSYEEFLKLRKRVENRMALLSIVGSEIDPNITPAMAEITKENPLISIQEQKMLEQLQLTWDDIEENKEVLGFDKLSLETFRQELYELFQQKRKELESIPNGVFTGFVGKPDLFLGPVEKGIIALIGYPKKEVINKDFKYEKIHLLYANKNEKPPFINDVDILNVLRKHKLEQRFIPKEIANDDSEVYGEFAEMLKSWLKWKSGKSAVDNIQDLFKFGLNERTKPKSVKIEEIYNPDKFDLITWFIVS